MIPFITMLNFIFRWGPLLSIREFLEIIDKFCSLKFVWFFSAQNLGQYCAKKVIFWNVGFEMGEKETVTFLFFPNIF